MQASARKTIWEHRISGGDLNWDELERLGDTARSVIPDGLSFESGRYLAGGSIVRALLGEAWADLDVWVPRGEVLAAASTLKSQGWRTLEIGEDYPGAGFRRCLAHTGKPYRIDLIASAVQDPADEIGRFDFRAVQVAFDGARLLSVDGALADIAAGRLVPTRRTRRSRIAKYVARGWRLVGEAEDVILPESATWDQVVGHGGVPVGAPTPAPEGRVVEIGEPNLSG